VDKEAVRRAYAFAEARHRAQVRNSGEPFITHPLGCARICAGLGLDGTAVVAALLHDTVEDTDATLDEIARSFGDEVRLLVDGVTKLSKIHFESQAERQAENYRKLIVAMSSDIRVLIVKLADRLHNMRTLAYMTKQKQIQKARRRSRSTPRWHTGWGSTRSSGSSRTWPSPRCTRGGTPRSSRW
jgi:guanosine-3',5'-bis(diphosphate) 3'-pyrophosphohydrolase